MKHPEQIAALAAELKAVFERRLGRFDTGDFIEVAAALGVEASVRRKKGPPLKPLGDANMPDLMGTNLAHAQNEFEWRRYRPTSDDGVIVHGFERVDDGD